MNCQNPKYYTERLKTVPGFEVGREPTGPADLPNDKSAWSQPARPAGD